MKAFANGSAAALGAVLAAGCGTLTYYEEPDDPTTSLEVPTDVDPSETSETTDTETSTPTDTDTEPTDTEPTDTEPTEPPDPLSLDSVEPDFGSNAGGLTLTLTGEFDAQTDVEVDGVAARIVSQRATRIEVELPRSNALHWVDVSVTSGTRTDILNDAFQYFEDASGQAGVVGSLAYLEYVGEYWNTNNPPPLAFGDLAFTTGPNWSLDKIYARSIGSCEYEFASPANLDPIELETGAASVRLVDGTGAASFRLDDDPANAGWFMNDTLNADTQVLPATTYHLDPVNGNADWPAFDVRGIVRVPGSFNVTSPRLAANQLQPQGRTIDLAWSGSGGDYMLVYIRRETSGGADNGYVTCAVPDTGSFRIPSNTWPNWPANNTLYVQIGRVLEQGGDLPMNDGENRMAGIYWVFGAAFSE
jgi:hypothetical protein